MTNCQILVTVLDHDKKNCIIAEAAKAFGRFGFKKASVDDIARAAGVAKGTVYLACESKEDLFYQAVHRELREWAATTAKLIDHRRAAPDLLVVVSQASLAYLDQHPLVRDLFEGAFATTLPAWAPRFEELAELGRANIVEILRLGIKQGHFRSEIDVDEVATLLQDLQISTHVLHRFGAANDERLARRASAGLDLVLNGLRVPGRTHT